MKTRRQMPGQVAARSLAVVAVAAAAVGAAALWWWWPQPAPLPPVSSAPALPAAAPAEPAVPVALPPSAAAPPEPSAASAPALHAGGLGAAFAQLLGAGPAATWLQLEDFPRRFVATVDNLDRGHAAFLLWPVSPTAGRFTVSERQGRTVIDPDNALRYAPFLQFIERADPAATVALYARLLPLLQTAYEELGYPNRRFHARLLSVIDHLLAAPQPGEPVEVRLIDVRGSVPSVRPWVRYEFADPALQSASAGHKLMLRVGAANQNRLKTWLRALHAELLRRP